MKLTSVLKQATKQVWGQSINARTYPQLSIGVTDKHVQEIHQPFNRFDNWSAQASPNVVFAWQSRHRPLQRASTYGLNGTFPTKLQPSLLRLYEWASVRWHEFLHQPSKTVPAISRSVRSIIENTNTNQGPSATSEVRLNSAAIQPSRAVIKRKRQVEEIDVLPRRPSPRPQSQHQALEQHVIETTLLSTSSSTIKASKSSRREEVIPNLSDSGVCGTFLRPIPELRAIICRHCESAYSKQTVAKHLIRRHYFKGHALKVARAWIDCLEFADDIVVPKHYTAPMQGILVIDGWACNMASCTVVSSSTQVIERHISKEHGLNSKMKRREQNAILTVKLQRFLAKPLTFVIVDTKLDSI